MTLWCTLLTTVINIVLACPSNAKLTFQNLKSCLLGESLKGKTYRLKGTTMMSIMQHEHNRYQLLIRKYSNYYKALHTSFYQVQL